VATPAIIIVIAVVLLFLSAAFSGLNIGLLSVHPDELKRKAERGDELAAKVYRYRRNGNYLIVCILIGNVAVISGMSIVLESVQGGLMAGLTTTLLITFLGEILPQSIFSRKGYAMSRYFFWLLDSIFVVLWPIAKPVSLLLDRLLGAELPVIYSREELADIVSEHAKEEHQIIDHDEHRIIRGALGYSGRTAVEVATKLEDVITLRLDETIDTAKLLRLRRLGHSRLPVYDPRIGRYVGIVHVKDLLAEGLPVAVRRIYRDKIQSILEDTPLDTVLSRFIQTKSHLFMVEDDTELATGVITLEDVLEAIIRREIQDEFDFDE